MASSILIDRDVPMEMRDGTKLRADIYYLNDGQKHPAILTRTLSNKRLIVDRGFLNLLDTVQAGYAVVLQDARGRFSSEGKAWVGDISYAVEAPDGYDSIEWIAAQPWCDGNIGMAGISHMGFFQFMAAAENPPHLKAIAPWMTGTTITPESTLLDGVIDFSVAINFMVNMCGDTIDKLEKQGKDVSNMRAMLNRARLNPEEVYNFLPLKDIPHFNFEGLKEFLNARVLKTTPTPGLEDRDQFPFYKVNIPCFHIGGWYDIAVRGTFLNFASMKEKGGSPSAREGQYLLIGPWPHFPYQSSLGDIDFGALADARGARVGEQNIDFFNKYLRGVDIKIPSVRYFVMGKGMWQNADAWPLSQTQWKRYFLHSRGHANTISDDGLLSQDEPISESPDIFIYNPHFPVITTGGRGHAACGFVAGPLDQSSIERRDDVLCYTSPTLKEDTEITGPVKLHLFASTSTRDTDFTTKLCDVYPDGRSYNIAEGIIRAKYRRSVFNPEMVTPGEVNEYIIDLANTSRLFLKGHCMRIDVSSSNFPLYDRNMNTGNPVGEDTKGIPATQVVYHDSEHGSYIDLPVIPPH